MRRSLFPGWMLSVGILVCSLFLLSGCQRETDGTIGGGATGGNVNDNVQVIAGVRGVVIDENGQPVQGAVVISGSGTTTTDRYGVFRFSNISLSKSNGYVKVTKAGYFTGSRSFVTTAGRTHHVRIRLLPKINAGSFMAAAGGTVSITGGGKLVIPANAVTDATGNSFTGTVNIAMTWIDPSATNLPEILVGDLRGLTSAGEERGLKTFGMLGVEMSGPGGQELKIASGKTAELTFPIPSSILSGAPATIDLWHFDETKGRWIQEGTAVKTGSNYVGQVSHFSFWNCDVPFPLVDLCMRLVNAVSGNPLNSVQVHIKRPDGSYGIGWTDSTGNLCGKVPKDEPLVLEVIDQCNAIAWSQNIGPFSANATLGTVAVSLPVANTLTITGTLTNCSNASVANGAMTIHTNNSYSYSVPVVNGSFSFTLIRCGTSTLNFAVTGIDLGTFKQSPMYNGSGTSGTVNIGVQQACGALDEFIEYIIDGTPYTWVDLGQPNILFTIDSVATGGFTTKTEVYGQFVTNGNMETTYFTFFNNTTPGTYPMAPNPYSIKVSNPAETIQRLEFIETANPMIHITAFGAPGTGYIEGNYNLMVRSQQGIIPQHVICHFRVKR